MRQLWRVSLIVIVGTVNSSAQERSIFEQKDGHLLKTQKIEQNTPPFGKSEAEQIAEVTGDAPPAKALETTFLTNLLKEFVGGWSGQLTIRTMQGQVVNRFDVEQHYWWTEEENKLESLAVFDDAGILRYAQSVNYIKEGILYSEVKEAVETKVYKASIEDDGIVWLPLDPQRALDHQLRQKIYSRDGKTYMMNKGFERYKRGNIDVMLLLEGELIKEEEEEATEPANTASETAPAQELDAPSSP